MADTDATQPPDNEAVDATVNATVVEPAADQTTPPISKRALKKAKKTALATTPALSAEEESERNIAASIDHPYLSFLHKRIRLYKKKLEKIKALETAQLQDGKKLNDQQAELVASKGLVEKMIAEFESLRGQFIEVFVAEEKDKETQQNANKPTTAEPEPVKDTNEVTKAPEEAKAPTTPVVAEPVDAVPRDAFAYVEDLLRTLHAVTLHQALGKDVPSVLDYFSKVVLGTTRPPAEVPFEENLAESLEEATRYLTKSEKIVVQEFTYQDLRTMVEKLGVETKEEVVEVTATVPAVADELPEINFFTDSVLDTEIEAAEPVTEDKENGHAESAEAIDSSLSGEDDRDEEDVSAPVVEAPPPSAIPVPPKSFAAAAASAPGSNKPATTRKPQTEGEDKPRRRPTSRSKPANSNSPRNDNTAEAPKSGGENSGKPRRSRAPRANDENASATHNVKRTSSAGGKGGEERRPRPVRKPTPPPTQQGTAKAAQ